MKNKKIIDFKNIQYQKKLKNLVDEIGLDEFTMTEINLTLSDLEKELLIKCMKYTIITLLDVIDTEGETEALNVVTFNQCELLESLEYSKNHKEILLLIPNQLSDILMSIELGGGIEINNQTSKYDETELWNSKEYETLIILYKDILEKCKIIAKITSPWETPEYLKNK